MGKVSTGFSMSLDGFVAGPNDDVQHVFAWMTQGDVEYTITTGDQEIELKMSAESVKTYDENMSTIGALVVGRRLFDIAGAWGGKHPLNVPIVVLTHQVPQEWANKESIFTFVTDGIESAIEQAQVIAGNKKVVVASPKLVQQCLNAGLLDEIHIDLVPFLLGDGIRLFEHLKISPVELADPDVKIDKGVTHLTYQIKK